MAEQDPTEPMVDGTTLSFSRDVWLTLGSIVFVVLVIWWVLHDPALKDLKPVEDFGPDSPRPESSDADDLGTPAARTAPAEPGAAAPLHPYPQPWLATNTSIGSAPSTGSIASANRPESMPLTAHSTASDRLAGIAAMLSAYEHLGRCLQQLGAFVEESKAGLWNEAAATRLLEEAATFTAALARGIETTKAYERWLDAEAWSLTRLVLSQGLALDEALHQVMARPASEQGPALADLEPQLTAVHANQMVARRELRRQLGSPGAM